MKTDSEISVSPVTQITPETLGQTRSNVSLDTAFDNIAGNDIAFNPDILSSLEESSQPSIAREVKNHDVVIINLKDNNFGQTPETNNAPVKSTPQENASDVRPDMLKTPTLEELAVLAQKEFTHDLLVALKNKDKSDQDSTGDKTIIDPFDEVEVDRISHQTISEFIEDFISPDYEILTSAQKPGKEEQLLFKNHVHNININRFLQKPKMQKNNNFDAMFYNNNESNVSYKNAAQEIIGTLPKITEVANNQTNLDPKSQYTPEGLLYIVNPQQENLLDSKTIPSVVGQNLEGVDKSILLKTNSSNIAIQLDHEIQTQPKLNTEVKTEVTGGGSSGGTGIAPNLNLLKSDTVVAQESRHGTREITYTPGSKYHGAKPLENKDDEEDEKSFSFDMRAAMVRIYLATSAAQKAFTGGILGMLGLVEPKKEISGAQIIELIPGNPPKEAMSEILPPGRMDGTWLRFMNGLSQIKSFFCVSDVTSKVHELIARFKPIKQGRENPVHISFVAQVFNNAIASEDGLTKG